MRKVIYLLIALLLCAALAVSGFAATHIFVPSITYKPTPISGSTVLIDHGDEEFVDGCVIVTSIEMAEKKTTDITQEERDLLLEVYEKLNKGEMTLPLDYDYVIRDLVDVSFKYQACRQIPEHNRKDLALKEEDVLLRVTFDLDVTADAQLDVLTYIDEEWLPIEEVINNGDGTVTCVFEDICPVAFVVK